ncbi:MAG: response regulator [Burkholderiales bacterium]|nr:response regulator [Burkholderiales bacterium]
MSWDQSALRPLRVLHVEDSELDHELMRAQLAHAGLEVSWTRVDDLPGFEQALAEGGWDAVICDHHLPGSGDLDGLSLLARLRKQDAWLPFLLVSGEIGEDRAVQAMREGATDYLLKGRLARLAPALTQAISAARAQRERQLAQQQLSALAAQLQERIEEERARLSRELHDEVGSALTALKFDLGWLQRHAHDERLAERAGQAQQVLDGAIAASRRLMQDLRPPILEEGLLPAVQWQLAQFERQHPAVACSLLHPPGEPDLPPASCLTAYRFVQEALHNIAKHAQASRVRVEMQWSSGVLGVEVQDDGQGMAAGALAQPTRLGLRGLQERAAGLGGWVDVSSRPGQGTLLALNLPLPDEPALPQWTEESAAP